MKMINIILGLGIGALIWALSPTVTGHKEPWDGSIGLYLGMLFVAGAICAIPRPRNWWMSVIGIYAGQWAYIFLVHGGGNLWPVGMIIGAIFMLASVAGGLIVWGIWRILRRTRREETK